MKNQNNLKTKFLMVIIGFLIFDVKAKAQCAHNPTVFPINLILCPNTSDTLWTQGYDAYQWYRNGNLIAGATNQFYVASANVDAGTYFSVNATLNSCTERSPQVLLDGWAFLPVTVSTIGNIDTICMGDTIELIMSLPYDTHIQWTDNGMPIPGAINDTLVVTSSGNYSVSGSPSLCPNFRQYLGLTLSYNFINCITGVDENNPQSIIAIYPNPTSRKVTVSGSEIISSIEVYNVFGVKIHTIIDFKQQTTNEIDLSQSSNGIYFVRIYEGEKIYTKKIVIQ